MIPPICVSIMANSLGTAISLAKQARSAGAALIEFRLDSLEGFGNLGLLANSVDLPKIATVRKPSEGGLYKGAERRRREVLASLAAEGFDYIDVELSTYRAGQLVREIQRKGKETIVSHHDFQRTGSCSRLKKIMKRQLGTGADICKIVTTANSWKDNLPIFEFLQRTPKPRRVVCFAMGSYGAFSRIFSPLLGGAFTYASVDDVSQAAPGQLSIHKMREIYQVISP